MYNVYGVFHMTSLSLNEQKVGPIEPSFMQMKRGYNRLTLWNYKVRSTWLVAWTELAKRPDKEFRQEKKELDWSMSCTSYNPNPISFLSLLFIMCQVQYNLIIHNCFFD